MMELGLVSVLNSGSPSVAGGRVYPRIPQSPVYPLIRYQRIATQRTNNIEGGNSGTTEFSVQLDCMARSYAEAKSLADDVMKVLHGYSGTWGSSICRFATLDTESDVYEQDGDDIIHWVSQRYLIWTNDD